MTPLGYFLLGMLAGAIALVIIVYIFFLIVVYVFNEKSALRRRLGK